MQDQAIFVIVDDTILVIICQEGSVAVICPKVGDWWGPGKGRIQCAV